MDNKHTPGPWEVEQGKKSDELFVRAVGGSRGRICRLWNGRTGREANARLIAAAPELLDACREALRSSQDEHGGGWIWLNDILRGAIAKAEGR